MSDLIKLIVVRCLIWLLCAAPVAQAAPDAQVILAQSDAVRNPDRSFSLVSSLIEYRKGREVERDILQVYSKADTHGGQFRNLVRFAAPARDANKLVLMNGRDMWFFDPGSKATIRISPQQRLLGEASNGDVVTVNFALDYKATLAAEEDVQDGDHQMCHAYKLALAAVSPDVTYDHIEIWIDTQNHRPIKSRLYTQSGTLLKTAYYRHFAMQLGQERPTEVVIIDGLNADWVTVMRYSDYAWQEVPESWLQRDYLPHFSPDASR
jgi:outer membrane lipoprotein-sorting protein